MIITICELGHKTNYNLTRWPRTFPKSKWVCKHTTGEVKCGKGLLSEDTAIINDSLEPVK